MGNWLKRRLWQPLLALLRAGISPERLALCVALGIVIGNIPLLGTSTILCTMIALLLRLNLPAMQLVQAAMAPTQLLLIVPYVRLGEWLLRLPPQPLSVSAARALMNAGIGTTIVTLWDAILHASLAFLLVGPPATYAFYRLLRPLFTAAAAASQTARTHRDT